MSNTMSRRTLLTAPAFLSLLNAAGAQAQSTGAAKSGSKTLVAYFTRSGNTRVIAGTVHRALGTDIFAILPAVPYPDDYEEIVEKARLERDRGEEPALAATVSRFAGYDTVYLGFPIWGETAPPIIRSFLRAHDLRGKTLRPFITHGGYGLGNSVAVLADHAPGAQIKTPFSMEADQERRTLNEVKGWLGTIRG